MGNHFRSAPRLAGLRGSGLRSLGMGFSALVLMLLTASVPASADPNCCSDAAKAPADYHYNPYGSGGAAVITVSPHGRLSIQRAIESVREGGTVRIEPGVYDETLRIRRGVILQATAPSTDQTRVVIRPSNLTKPCLYARLDGRDQLVAVRGLNFEMAGARGNACVQFESSGGGRFELSNSKVTGDGQVWGSFGNSNGGAVSGGAAVVIDGGSFRIERNTISGGIIGVHVRRAGGGQSDIRYNSISGNGTGIRVEASRNVQITSNLVQNNSTGIYTFVEGGRVNANLVSRNYGTGMQLVYANLVEGGAPPDQVSSNNITDNYYGLLLSAAADDQMVRSEAADAVLSDRALRAGDELATRCSGGARDTLLCTMMNVTIINNCVYSNEVGVLTRDRALRRQEVGNNIVYNNRLYGVWGIFKGTARKACERQEYNYGQSITSMLSSWGFW